ncbi:hypothetical protein CIP107549_00002 [Corynebacterium diphtheriae]|nr:hypothetical protein CIP107549_00002 [Corynebacterium diphtheriae]
MTFEMLIKACAPGGASTWTSVTDLTPASGSHASIAPAKFVVERNSSTFAYETRFVDNRPVQAVVIDSKQSSINRGENAISYDMTHGHPIISRIPRVQVRYDESTTLTDLDLPHRAFDGHIRGGFIEGKPATEHESFRAVRNSTLANASSILNVAPAALIYGGWDATRKANQLRVRSSIVGEIIGVLADQDKTGPEQQAARGGARIDPIAASVKLSPEAYRKIIDAQREELSKKNYETADKIIKKSKKGETLSASNLGLGAIPPSLDPVGGVSCQRIIRSWVLSFASLRQIRFGGSLESDVAGRALLAALGLSTIARAEQELYLRANCDLVEADAPVVKLDQRYGEFLDLQPLTIEKADALLEEAMNYAEQVGVVTWQGQTLEVIGNPDILGGAVEEEPEES